MIEQRTSIVDLAPVTSPYGDTGGRTTPHNGIDIGVPVGTPLQTQVGGQVERTVYDRTGGLQVIVRTVQGYEEVFAHLSNAAVAIGDTLSPGDLIGYSGASGDVTGPHVHYEIRPPGGRGTIDPMRFLSEFVPGFAADHGLGSPAPTPAAQTVSSTPSSAPASASPSGDVCPGGGELTQIGPLTFCRYSVLGFPVLTPAVGASAPGAIKGASTVLATITDPHRWAQLAFTAAGVAMIIAGVLLYTGTLKEAPAVAVAARAGEA